jgi:hypothetical protein
VTSLFLLQVSVTTILNIHFSFGFVLLMRIYKCQCLLHLISEAVVFKILPPKSQKSYFPAFLSGLCRPLATPGALLCFVLIPRAYALGYGAAVLRDSKFPAPAGRRKFPHSKSVGAVFSVSSPVFWYCFTICPLALYSVWV